MLRLSLIGTVKKTFDPFFYFDIIDNDSQIMKKQAKTSYTTKQRKAILEILRKDKKHLTAEEIATKLKNRVGLATIYRNLKQLVCEGIINEVVSGGLKKYEGIVFPHGHFYCEICGEVWDFELCGCDQCHNRMNIPTGSEVKKFSFEIWGICKKCKNNNG